MCTLTQLCDLLNGQSVDNLNEQVLYSSEAEGHFDLLLKVMC